MMHRRAFLKTITIGTGALALGNLTACAPQQDIAGRYARVEFGSYLSGLRIETLVDGDDVFLEGPAVGADGGVYFTDIPSSRILRWDPSEQQLELFRENSHMANGLLFDPDGRLLVCEGATGRLTRTNITTGETEIIADAFDGHDLEPVNDVTLDAQGRAYFTSRPSGGVPRSGVYVNAVYRADPDGSVHQLLAEPQVDMPNGIVVSPDQRTLYLIEAHSDAGRSRHVKAFDLSSDGTLSNERILIDFYPGRSGDGMCIDEAGNLYVAAGLHELRGTSETLDTRPGVHVISPEGSLLDFLETPEDTITNCTFGGADLRTLYVTAGRGLFSAASVIPGDARYRPLG